MCGPDSPLILNLDEVPWRKFQCQDCGHTFRIMSRDPRCPECQSSDLVHLTSCG